MRFIVIGITDNPQPWFPPEVLQIIKQGKVFSGGKRHHEIVAPLLPESAEWIDITVPLDAVFEAYNVQCSIFNVQCVTVFASGDPLFFGFANTIKRRLPEAEVVVYPTFNSLQMLAHRLVMPYHDMRIVSLTGRPWQEFDRALIEMRIANPHQRKIGVLTDREHTPATIAQRMLEYGYHYYNMYIGEHLGNPEREKVMMLSLDEAARREFTMPNCVILEGKTVGHTKPYGIPDAAFALLDGREKMITKMPIRLLTLQALELPRASVFWDIGACTGSVSVEARLLFPHLRVVAFEIRPECEAIIRENCRRHGAPGIELVMGDFLALGARPSSSADVAGEDDRAGVTTALPSAGEDDRAPRVGVTSALPSPDAVFIGGHGGRLKEIMAKVLTVLAPDGVIVMNSVVAPKVTTDSRRLWDEACSELGLRQDEPLHIQLNDHHPITILKCRR